MHRRAVSSLLSLVLLVALTPFVRPLAAQSEPHEPLPLLVGDRVRTEIGEPTHLTGIFLEASPTAIRVRTDQGVPVRERDLAYAEMEWLEVVRGKGRSTVKGLAWGAGIGAGLGLLGGAGGGNTGAAMYYGALGGAFWGAIIGTFIKTDRWERVDLDAVRAGSGAQGLAVRLRTR